MTDSIAFWVGIIIIACFILGYFNFRLNQIQEALDSLGRELRNKRQ